MSKNECVAKKEVTPTKLTISIDLPSYGDTNILEAISHLDLRFPYAERQVTVEDLIVQLLEDVCCMIERPGSWEGAGMERHLQSHGIFDFDHDDSHLR